MTNFSLEVSGSGPAICLEPVGMMDVAAAKVLLEALAALRAIAKTAFVEIRLDRVAGLTKAAWRLLVAGDLPVGQLTGLTAV